MNIWKALELKFTSGNSIAVTQVAITRAEYDELLADNDKLKRENDNLRQSYE